MQGLSSKLIVALPAKEYSAVMEPEGSFMCQKSLPLGPVPSLLNPDTLLHAVSLWYILLSYLRLISSYSLRFPN